MIVTLMQAVVHIGSPVVAPPSPPSPPPPIILSGPERGVSYLVDVEVRAGATVLWRGALRVATNASASFRQNLSQAPETVCGMPRGYIAPVETGLSLQLSPDRFTDSDPGRLRIAVRWVRAGLDRCPAYGSTRAIELNDTVLLAPGTTATINGDGDLSVRLTRR